MEQKITRTIHRTSKLDPSQAELYRALSALANVVSRVLGKEIEPKVYCQRCRVELGTVSTVPNQQVYCLPCEERIKLEARIQARILPKVKTIGGSVRLG